MELSEVVETFEHNLQQLKQAQVGNYLSFFEFDEKVKDPSVVSVISDMERMKQIEEATASFQCTLEYHFRKTGKYDKLLDFSKKLHDGMKTSVSAFNEWRYEQPTGLHGLWLKISKNAENKYRESKKPLIKNILSFKDYATAHLALRDYVPKFCQMYQPRLRRVEWGEYESMFQPSFMNDEIADQLNYMLPVPKHEDIFYVCINFLAKLAHETGTKVERKQYMKGEGALYTI
ncbi:hypothetical protein HY636_05465 [Candidatus Woesearchaeota archaeon]|nr:hypothetical protein [Candidatus Woesearchaeota archaeon]